MGLRLAHGLRKAWWRVHARELVGTSIMVFDPRERLLLVRHSYGAGNWLLPGGGLRSGEEPASGAARELWEELRLTGTLRPVAVLIDQFHRATNIVHLFAITTAEPPRIDGRELVEARFFPLDDLPGSPDGMVARRVAAWRGSQQT